MNIFVDSDVVISALLSSTGAAYFLLHQSQIQPIISSLSLKELEIVVKRLNIETQKFKSLVKNQLQIVKIIKEAEEVKKEYGKYVNDNNDAHIVAGAYAAKTEFLISYNLRHFKTSKIKDELDILILTPALFLQHLRSN